MKALTGACALATILLSAATHATLAPALVGKIEVDTAWATGLPQATDIAFAGDGRAIITRKTGELVIRQVDGALVALAYPFGGTLDSVSEKGLLGVVADPAVATNKRFYFYVSNGPTNDKHRVYGAVLTAANTLTVDASPLIAAGPGRPGLEGPANHAGGGLVIHAGQLYVGVGDTGANASPPTNKYGSCLNKPNGKVLRVNLDGSVPGNNPLVGVAAVSACATPTGAWTSAAPDPRIFAWGMRNPWRIWVDPVTGLLWTGDVGEGNSEEVSIGGAGEHFGYPFVEGSQVWGNVEGLNCASLSPSRPCSPPAFAYGRTVGRAITGGLVLDSAQWQAALGGVHYLFGDSSAHWVRALPVNGARTGFSASSLVDVANYAGARPVSFRQGPDGALYVVMLGLGAVYRFGPATIASIDAQRVPFLPPAALLALATCIAGLGARRLRQFSS